MEKKWLPKKTPAHAVVERLEKELSVENTIATLLAQRDINTFDEARDFFRPALEKLHDPFLMKDMERAVNRLSDAIHQNEKILVFGDYDVDGTTAVTMTYSFLKSIDVACDFYIPDRYTEGYGFSMNGVDYAKANH